MRKLLEEIHPTTGATTPSEKRSLAEELRKLARNSSELPHEQFVLLRKATELAADGGDLASALASLSVILEEYEIDSLTARQEIIARFAKIAVSSSDFELLVGAENKLIRDGRRAGRYREALEIAEFLNDTCQKSGGLKWRKAVVETRNDLRLLHQEFLAVDTAWATLMTEPDNAAANLRAGRWLCLERNDWPVGLPLIVKSRHATLAPAAEQDLAAPTVSEEILACADRWHELGMASEVDRGLLVRAAYWYQLALPLASGLAKAKIDKRLEDIRGRPELAERLDDGAWRPPSGSTIAGGPPLAIAPFDSSQAKVHQAVWARHLGTTIERTNSVDGKLILIPPGEFLLGSNDEQVEAALLVAEKLNANDQIKTRIATAEQPQHRVVIDKPFYLGATEVTIGQFRRFAAATGYITEDEKADKASNYLSPGYSVTQNSPAARLTWNDAMAYCKWLSEKEKAVYRLPTEAEWEYACRAGTITQYSFGDDHSELGKYAWYDVNAGGKSHPVGTKLPNAFGLHDMHGNVHEWCQDFYDDASYHRSLSKSPASLPRKSSSDRVLRGGFWDQHASYCRSASRANSPPSFPHYINYGFRCVREW